MSWLVAAGSPPAPAKMPALPDLSGGLPGLLTGQTGLTLWGEE